MRCIKLRMGLFRLARRGIEAAISYIGQADGKILKCFFTKRSITRPSTLVFAYSVGNSNKNGYQENNQVAGKMQ